MKRDMLCMICCHSYKSRLKKGKGGGCVEDQLQDQNFTGIVAEFDRQVLSEWKALSKSNVGVSDSLGENETERGNMDSEVAGILESCKPLNITICGNCLTKMKNVISARSEAAILEQRVRELQVNLLQELKRLQCQMDCFYAEMKRIEFDVSSANTSRLAAELMKRPSRCGRKLPPSIPGDQLATRRKRVYRLRNQLSEVAKDIHNYQSEMSERFASTIIRHGNEAQVQTKCSKDPAQDIQIKEETDNENNECQFQDETNFEDSVAADLSLPVTPKTAPKLNSNVEIDEENAWDDAGVDEQTSEICEQVKDEDCDPFEARTKNAKLEEKERESILLEGMPEFTKRVVSGVLLRMRSSQYKNGKTLYLKSLQDLKYDEQRQVILLKEEVIHILDKEVNPEVENGLECGRCSFKVSAVNKRLENEMYNHILSKHLEVYRCPKCGVLLETYRKYQVHLERMCPRNARTCDICGKPILSDCALRYHKFLHMNEEEKQQELAKGYKPPIHRKPTELTFQCQTCGKRFGKKDALKGHLESHISRDQRKQIICPTCGKSFLQAAWYHHLRIGCGKEILLPPAQCLICNATLKNVYYLKKHMRYKHQQRDKVHTCEQCGKSFKMAGLLRTHCQRVHVDGRPHKCDNCGATYKTRGNLSRHEMSCKTRVEENSGACKVLR